MAEPRITEAEVPAWTDGWTAGYAAGIKRALADCPSHGVCPNCREGWGHYTPEHGYLPTAQSEEAGRWCPDCAGGRVVRDPQADTYTPCSACTATAEQNWGHCPHCGDWCVLDVHGVAACGERQ